MIAHVPSHQQSISIVIPSARSTPDALISSLIPQLDANDEILLVRNRPSKGNRHWVGIKVEEEPSFAATKWQSSPITKTLNEQPMTKPTAPILLTSTGGAAAARNLGWLNARNSTILFLDDDVNVGVDFLGEIKGWLSQKHCASIVGFRVVDTQKSRWSPLAIAVLALDRGPDVRYTDGRSLGLHEVWMYGVGAALLVKRNILEEMGGFKDELGSGCPNGGAEDTEFIWHGSRHTSIAYVGSINVRHEGVHTLEEIRRKIREYGKAIGHLGAIAPQVDRFRYIRGYSTLLFSSLKLNEVRSISAIDFARIKMAVVLAVIDCIRVFAFSSLFRRQDLVLCKKCWEAIR